MRTSRKGKDRALSDEEAEAPGIAISATNVKHRLRLQQMRNVRKFVQDLADLPHRTLTRGKLAKARALWYNVDSRFCQLTYKDDHARRLANFVLQELVSLHLPYSLSDKIENLLARFEEQYDTRDAFIGPYNMLVKSYAQRMDVQGAVGTLERMKELGLQVPNLLPNERTYNHLVTMYAHRREPESARAAFEEMFAAGIEPTQSSYTSLMNSHVEAGQWEQAVAIFEHLDGFSDDHPLKPDASTCTTLIKCYTLMGASTADVLSVYAGMVRRKIKPTPRTFVLLLQSAADGGQMDFAEEVFAKMLEMPHADFGRKLEMMEEAGLVNQYAFTIMIRGFIRAGQQEAAKEYYEEMIRRGIEPSSSIWSTLIGAYADARVNDPQADRIIKNLLNEFLRTYVENEPDATHPEVQPVSMPRQTLRLRRYKKDKAVARATALHSVYGPVITAYGKVAGAPVSGDDLLGANESSFCQPEGFDNSQQAALRVLDSFKAMHELPEAKPSIHIYTTLLDAYRRANDVDRVREIWQSLFKLAKSSGIRSTPSRAAREMHSENFGRVRIELSPSQRNLLCLPLSIYIDALSQNHMHDEVAEVWFTVQAAGFGFDAGNWNHLIVALLRAGEIERAFWIAEKVLLKPSDQGGDLVQSIPEALVVEDADGGRAEGAALEHSSTADAGELEAQAAQVEPAMRPPNRSHELMQDDKHTLRYADTVLRLPEEADLSTTAARPVHQDDLPSSGEANETDDEQNSDGPMLRSASHIPGLANEATKHQATEEASDSLASAFSSIRQRRRKYVWTIYNATLRMLEDTFIRLQRLAEGDRESDKDAGETTGQQHVAIEQLQHLQQGYPKTFFAIEEFRRKQNRLIRRSR